VSDRFGAGKWVYSGSKATENMVKEGKYKMINPAAYIRPTLAQLVYAQWTIRVASDMIYLCETRSGPSPMAILKNETLKSEAGSSSTPPLFEDVRLTLSGATLKKKLQCVLYFGPPSLPPFLSPFDTVVSPSDNEDMKASNEVSQSHTDEPQLQQDITQPNLPTTLMDRSHVLRLAKVHSSEKSVFTVPMYDMERLFHNHQAGFKAIQQACVRRLFLATPKGSSVDHYPRWIGLAESQKSLPVAKGLWKLASILPKTTPTP
ncbi:hypothetical protein BGZ65_008175, partial [Modicella reniformis]